MVGKERKWSLHCFDKTHKMIVNDLIVKYNKY